MSPPASLAPWAPLFGPPSSAPPLDDPAPWLDARLFTASEFNIPTQPAPGDAPRASEAFFSRLSDSALLSALQRKARSSSWRRAEPASLHIFSAAWLAGPAALAAAAPFLSPILSKNPDALLQLCADAFDPADPASRAKALSVCSAWPDPASRTALAETFLEAFCSHAASAPAASARHGASRAEPFLQFLDEPARWRTFQGALYHFTATSESPANRSALARIASRAIAPGTVSSLELAVRAFAALRQRLGTILNLFKPHARTRILDLWISILSASGALRWPVSVPPDPLFPLGADAVPALALLERSLGPAPDFVRDIAVRSAVLSGRPEALDQACDVYGPRGAFPKALTADSSIERGIARACLDAGEDPAGADKAMPSILRAFALASATRRAEGSRPDLRRLDARARSCKIFLALLEWEALEFDPAIARGARGSSGSL